LLHLTAANYLISSFFIQLNDCLHQYITVFLVVADLDEDSEVTQTTCVEGVLQLNVAVDSYILFFLVRRSTEIKKRS
jgi:hypothetical protein